jgi:hypothetical protein
MTEESLAAGDIQRHDSRQPVEKRIEDIGSYCRKQHRGQITTNRRKRTIQKSKGPLKAFDDTTVRGPKGGLPKTF